MLFLKAVTTDGKVEFLNAQNILSMQPQGHGEKLKILMGAGLYWIVETKSVELVELENMFK